MTDSVRGQQIERNLRRLQLYTITTLAVALLAVVCFAGVSVHQVRELNAQQVQLRQLTDDLCRTLQRAGILIHGSEENPCGS